MHKDSSLIGLDEVRKVLASEETKYERVRAEFREREPLAAKNLTTWIEDELKFLANRYPTWTRDQFKMVAFLLERYFVRGVSLVREGYAGALNQWYEAPSADKEGLDAPEDA